MNHDHVTLPPPGRINHIFVLSHNNLWVFYQNLLISIIKLSWDRYVLLLFYNNDLLNQWDSFKSFSAFFKRLTTNSNIISGIIIIYNHPHKNICLRPLPYSIWHTFTDEEQQSISFNYIKWKEYIIYYYIYNSNLYTRPSWLILCFLRQRPATTVFAIRAVIIIIYPPVSFFDCVLHFLKRSFSHHHRSFHATTKCKDMRHRRRK